MSVTCPECGHPLQVQVRSAPSGSVAHPGGVDPGRVDAELQQQGHTARTLAAVLYPGAAPTAAEVERARRALESRVRAGVITRVGGEPYRGAHTYWYRAHPSSIA